MAYRHPLPSTRPSSLYDVTYPRRPPTVATADIEKMPGRFISRNWFSFTSLSGKHQGRGLYSRPYFAAWSEERVALALKIFPENLLWSRRRALAQIEPEKYK